MIRCKWSFSTEKRGLFNYAGESWDSAIGTMLALLPRGAAYTLYSEDGQKLMCGVGSNILYAHRLALDSICRLFSYSQAL